MKALRFLHIPKTAGSTLSFILNRLYKNEIFFSFTGDATLDDQRFSALSEYEKNNIGVFIGHAPVVTGIRQADDATIVTFLRDPVDRVRSICQHVSEGKSQYLLEKYPPDKFCLDEFLESGIMELSNYQTTMLVNQRNKVSPISINKMSEMEAREAALENLLDKISCFGLQEYFDESLIMLSSTLNWKMPLYESKNKKNINNLIQFEKSHLERIEDLNRIDIEVYRLAKEIFVCAIESEEFDRNKLKRFQLLNKLAGNIGVSIMDKIIR